MLRPFRATVRNEDYVAESNDRTVDNFRGLLGKELLSIASTAGVPVRDGEGAVSDTLLTALVRCISTSTGFKIATEELGCPVLLQPTFCIAFGRGYGGRAPRQCHVVTFAFVAQVATEQPRGRPGAQFTGTVVRIRSPNLLLAENANAGGGLRGPNALRFEYDVFAATHETAAAEMLADLKATGGNFGLSPLA